MNNFDKGYIELLQNILENGTDKADRTGTGTRSITGAMIKHDMADGFPALTTKKLFFKTMSTELEGFVKGITDKRWYRDRNMEIWSNWARPSIAKSREEQFSTFDLGPLGYSNGLRNFGGTSKIIPQPKSPYIDNIFKYDIKGKKKYKSKNYGMFVILNKNSNSSKIMFILTGYIVESSNSNINSLSVKDPYYPKVAGAGAIGELNTEYDERLKTAWNNMIYRCYDETDKDYHLYGGKGVTVSSEWLVFSNFANDVKELSGWDMKIKTWDEYSIDKDYNGLDNYIYSKDTCRWSTRKQQSTNKGNNILFDVELPNGDILEDMNSIINFSKIYNLYPSEIVKALDENKNSIYKNFRFFNKRVLEKKSKVVKGYDQLSNLLDTLKNNPNSRRMVVSYWDLPNITDAALPPCHYVWQVVVRGEFLDLVFNMRSVDVLLGMPFDIAHYGLMLSLLAKQFNYTPGTLTGFFGDTHIYNNHFAQVKEQISRLNDAYDLPQLKINDSFTDLRSVEVANDLELINYKCHPAIKAPIAI